jgi:hypothetical protein
MSANRAGFPTKANALARLTQVEGTASYNSVIALTRIDRRERNRDATRAASVTGVDP